MIVNVLTILCYALFLYFIRKATAVAGNDNMRNIYKSLIVTTLTVVFGYFTTTIIGTTAQVLNLDIPKADVNLLAGTFVSTSCAINIFVYYFISREYRHAFQKHLGCRGPKKTSVQILTQNGIPLRNHAARGRMSVTVS
ncbi:hypothetical protein V3C99_006920 [Haemonchus contortus]